MANILEPLKKYYKIWKICLWTYYIAGRGLGSLGLHCILSKEERVAEFDRIRKSKPQRISLLFNKVVEPCDDCL